MAIISERDYIYPSRTCLSDLQQSIVFDEPKVMAGTSAPWVLVPAWHKDANGKKRSLQFISPKQFVYDTIRRKMMKTDADPVGKLKEFYVRFPMASMDTVNSPTDEEKTFNLYLDTVSNTVYSYLMELYKTEKNKARTERNTDLPSNFMSTMAEAISEDDPSIALKPVTLPGASYDEERKVWVRDPKRPAAAIFKIWTNGPCDKVYTQIRGPRGKVLDIKKDKLWSHSDNKEKKSANVTMRISFDGVYLGGHGTKQSWCASLRFRIHEMNYTPVARTMGVSYLENTDDDVLETGLGDGDSGAGVSSFVNSNPMDNDETPFELVTVKNDSPTKAPQEEVKQDGDGIRKKKRKNKHLE